MSICFEHLVLSNFSEWRNNYILVKIQHCNVSQRCHLISLMKRTAIQTKRFVSLYACSQNISNKAILRQGILELNLSKIDLRFLLVWIHSKFSCRNTWKSRYIRLFLKHCKTVNDALWTLLPKYHVLYSPVCSMTFKREHKHAYVYCS